MKPITFFTSTSTCLWVACASLTTTGGDRKNDSGLAAITTPPGVEVLGTADSFSGSLTERAGADLAFLPDGRLLVGAPSHLIGVGEMGDQNDDAAWVTPRVEGIVDFRYLDPAVTITLNDPWSDGDWYSLSNFGTGVAAIGDVTGDGIEDIAVGDPPNPSANRGQWGVFPGPSYSSGVPLLYGYHSDRAAPCGDMDSDGVGDLCTGIGVVFGPIVEGAGWGLSWSAESPQVLAADLDVDGSGDLLVSDATTHAIYRLSSAPRIRGQVVLASLAATTWTASDGYATALAVGDLDGDGADELVAGWSSAGGDVVLVGLPAAGGDPLIDARTTLPVAGEDLAIGDFDGDGQVDLAVGGASEVTVWLGPLGAGPRPIEEAVARYRGTQYPTDNFGTSLAAMDTDGDGRAELAIGAPDETETPPAFAPTLPGHTHHGRVWWLDAAGL